MHNHWTTIGKAHNQKQPESKQAFKPGHQGNSSQSELAQKTNDRPTLQDYLSHINKNSEKKSDSLSNKLLANKSSLTPNKKFNQIDNSFNNSGKNIAKNQNSQLKLFDSKHSILSSLSKQSPIKNNYKIRKDAKLLKNTVETFKKEHGKTRKDISKELLLFSNEIRKIQKVFQGKITNKDNPEKVQSDSKIQSTNTKPLRITQQTLFKINENVNKFKNDMIKLEKQKQQMLLKINN